MYLLGAYDCCREEIKGIILVPSCNSTIPEIAIKNIVIINTQEIIHFVVVMLSLARHVAGIVSLF